MMLDLVICSTGDDWYESIIQKSVCISGQLAQGLITQAGLVSIHDQILLEGNVAFTCSK